MHNSYGKSMIAMLIFSVLLVVVF